MMIRTEPKPEFSLRQLATLVIGIVGFTAATVAVAASSSTSADIGSVLHRAQSEQTARGFENLLGTLGAAAVTEPAASVTPVGKTVPVTVPSKHRSQQNA